MQDNGEERSDETPYRIFSIKRTVTAEDVTRGRVRIDTGLSSIINYIWKLTDSTNVVVLWNGAVSVSGGVVEFDNSGAVDFANTNIFYLWAIGAE